ncbi:Ion transport protein-domain-containing protein [Blakeslea trispora]|nr:Ion transport protein-domain-containing protein [Blakeslea trispora]
MFVLLIFQWLLLSLEPNLIGSISKTPTSLSYLFIQCIFTLEMVMKIIVYGFYFKTRPSFHWFSRVLYRQKGYALVNTPELEDEIEQQSTPSAYHYRDRLTSFAAENAIRPASIATCHSDLSSNLPSSSHPLLSSTTDTSSTSFEPQVIQIQHDPYCASLVNQLDLIALSSYWIQLMLTQCYHPWPPLYVGNCLRLFRLLALTEGTQALMVSIYASIDMLKNVMGFFMFFWVLFSLAAVGLFPNAFTRQCAYVVNKTVRLIEPRKDCAGYWSDHTLLGPLDWPSQTQLIYTGMDGYYCQTGQVCIQDIQNQPMYGHLSFQHMGYAMLNMFTIISTENWTDLLYIAQDSTSTWGAALFFSCCIYVMTFILVPMFIAVITTSFSQDKQTLRTKEGNDLQEHWIDSAPPFVDQDRWQALCYHVSHHVYFKQMMNGLALLSVFPMTWYPIDLSTDAWTLQIVSQKVFDCLFGIELLIRITSYSDRLKFWSDKRRNQLDSVIVLATVLDSLPFLNNWHTIFILFPIIRFYRIFFLFPGVLKLLSDVIGDGQGIQNLTCFTFLVLFILSSISVQLFGGDFGFVQGEAAMSFDSFYQAFLSIFQIMTGENWVDILYDAMHSQEYASVTFAALFIGLVYFIVHYLVLNLFVAVIMQNFDLEDEEIKRIQIKKYLESKQSKPEYFQLDRFTRLLVPLSLYLQKKLLELKHLPHHLIAHVNKHQFKQFYLEDNLDTPTSPWINPPSPPASILSTQSSLHQRKSSIASLQPTSTTTTEPMNDYDAHVAKENSAVVMENLQLLHASIMFGHGSRAHQVCTRWVSSWIYKTCIVVLICLGSGLALWSDAYHRTEYAAIHRLLEPVHMVLLVLYLGNITVHSIADGLIVMPHAYLRNIWNALDLVNLILQAVLMTQSSQMASYLRVLRTLRILRIMYHVQTMRRIFLDLVYGLPKLVDVILLNLLVFLPFATYGCVLFAGRFASCNDEGLLRQACLFEFASKDTMGILVPRVWQNPYDYSYDTFGASFLHLFENASGEGWIRSLFTAMSIQSDKPPEFDWSQKAMVHSLYYVLFMFIASLCSIQLFIGVFLEIFKQRSGLSQLTSQQRQFQDLQRQLGLLKPSRRVFRPNNPIRAMFYDLVINKRGRFARAMANVIMLNIMIFATEHLYQPSWLTQIQNVLNGICIGLYIFEIIAKMLGFGFSKWKSIAWNLYDFVLVCLVLVTFILKFYMGQNNLEEFMVTSCSKLFSVGIAFRLVQRIESLDTLFKSIRRALPSIVSVSCVFGLVMLCFGVLFQEIFGLTRYGPYGNDHANFRSLFNSILTLFRITTGEDWDALMHDFFVRPFDCVNENDCGSPRDAIFLFTVFYIMCTYIFVNLFTMIVIDNFSFAFDKRNRFTLITRSDLRDFKLAWSQEDPYATGYIQISQVPRFLQQLEGALSLRIYDEKYSIASLIQAAKRFDLNPTHSASLSYPFGQSNKDQPFNFYQVNQQLATMDTKTIQSRKKRYAQVYQEIIHSSTRKGIEFRSVLTILAMQLVDASTSLTFDALIRRARIKRQIEQQLAVEHAQGLIHMMADRRRFLAWRQSRQKRPSTQKRNSMAIVGQWLHPSVTTPKQHQKPEGVPKIVINSTDSRRSSSEYFYSPLYSASLASPLSGQEMLRRNWSSPSLLSPSGNAPFHMMSHLYVDDEEVQHMDERTADHIMMHLNQSVWSEMLAESEKSC